MNPGVNRKTIEDLGNPFIGIELKDGDKIFGTVNGSDHYQIFVRSIKHRDIVIDIPREIIKRAFMLIKGGK